MTDDALEARRPPRWSGSAAWWLLAWLLVSAMLVASAVLASLLGTTLVGRSGPVGAGVPGDIEAMARMTAAMLPAMMGASAAAALLAGLPFQVVALHLRRRGAGSGVFASVAMLTCVSAILSFGALSWRNTVYAELLQPSTLLLAAVLAGFYFMHVVILHVARALAARRRPADTQA